MNGDEESDFAALSGILDAAVRTAAVPGAVASVGGARGEYWTGAAGTSDPAGRRALQPDSRFRLASMTKLITAVAVMQQVDAGRLTLETPVADVLPDFARLPVLEGVSGNEVLLRPAVGRATVRQLLAHTSGLSYEVWNPMVLAYQGATGTPGIASGRRAVLDTPLVADPGTTVEYGTGLDWAGQLVEKVSGRCLDEVCAEGIFGPLAMSSTSMERQDGRDHVPVLSRSGDGFASTAIDYPAAPDFRTGGGCVWSTAPDFLRLLRMLIGDGVLDGTRVLSEASVSEVLSVQTGGLPVPAMRSCVPALSADVDLGPGWYWGLGLMINTVGEAGLRSAGSGGWWGIFNSTFWVDRRTGIAAVLMMQFVPFFDAGACALARDFEAAIYRATLSNNPELSKTIALSNPALYAAGSFAAIPEAQELR